MIKTAQRFFEARPESVRQARDFVSTTLTGWSRAERHDDIRLCVSELATNALVHGTVADHGFLLRLNAEDGVVRLEVHDSRRRRPEPVTAPPPTCPDAVSSWWPRSPTAGASRTAHHSERSFGPASKSHDVRRRQDGALIECPRLGRAFMNAVWQACCGSPASLECAPPPAYRRVTKSDTAVCPSG
ncbi:ATP-binding protein [Streptomyces sp. NPDC005549]|uniref:ATP-binding protein n=1 Tax=Streptomyces sp. NPDC005549 TaxID=3154888 RepID=UPI0033A1C751